MSRSSSISRETRETRIGLELALDPAAEGGASNISTSLPFLDHMLDTLAVHGGISLRIAASGDVAVDPHHLVEDCGIALGRALAAALTDNAGKRYGGIARCGWCLYPMDGSLAQVALDLCGRPNLLWKADLLGHSFGLLPSYLFRDFFKGLADGAECTLHISVPYLDNDHHAVEAVFKAFARALRQAVTPAAGVLSTKGGLDG